MVWFLSVLIVATGLQIIVSAPTRPNENSELLVSDSNPIDLSLSYYSQIQYLVSTEQNEDTYIYAQWTQCDNTRAGYDYIVASILQYSNAKFDPTLGSAVMEVSICPHSFSAECVVATNYHYDSNSGILQGYNNITMLYNISIPIYYFRLKAEVAGVSVAIHIGYVANANPTFLKQVDWVFATTNGNPTAKWNYFNQIVKVDEVSNVDNGQTILYYASFCKADINNADYTAEITVTGTPSTILAGFNLAGCSKSRIANVNSCQVTNGGQPGVVATQNAASSTSVKLNDATYSLADGIYVRIMGVGGELNGNNEYLLTIAIV
jgi:hypothetical protein